MVGSMLGNYEILAPLGAGGMGKVYRAHDPRLRRDVAIKVLAQQDTDGSRRLLREARTASALNHPNICVIHEVGEDAGHPFIVMELVEGKPLGEIIPADGLPEEGVIRYGTQIADALAHAHERGIVHRDLKSANVIVTPDGRAKVLDFGLAARLSPTEAEAVTQTQATLAGAGMPAGTLAYMAPEVLRCKPLAPASDIWALGVLLYEMATGRLPFAGASAVELTAAILKDEPYRLRTEVQAGIGAVLRRALAKDLRHRYGTAAEVRAALQAVGSAGAAETLAAREALPMTSIVVLPFANLGAGSDDEYFADGMTEEIINALVNLSGLRVIARTSSFSFKGKNVDVREIGRKLGVEAVVEGSVRRAGNRLRITAQLIDASDGHHLWSERYDRELEDVFAIQDEIAGIVARRLRAEGIGPPTSERPTDNIEAYEAYLRGRFFWAKGSPGDYAKSTGYYERAVALDPGFAPAFAGMADTYLYWGLVAQPQELFTRARAAILRAIELDDTLADAHVTLGMIRFFSDWDWNGAIAALERALSLNPNAARAHQTLGTVMANLGRAEEAVVHARRGVSLDPLSAQTLQTLQYTLHQAGKYEDSLGFGDKALELAPEYVLAHLVRGFNLLALGRTEDAERTFRKVHAISPGETMAQAGLVHVLALRGHRDDAEELLGDIERADAASGPVAISAAWANALVGNVDRAFHWIERAIAAREPFVASMPSFLWWDPLRPDPRFEKTLRRLGFPEWSIEMSSERSNPAM